MKFPVVKGAAYALIHASNLLFHQGTTQIVERRNNPDSEYLTKLPNHLRNFEEAVNYPPNQAYIGNLCPDELKRIPRPWYVHPEKKGSPRGKYGDIFSEDEFIGMLKVVDAFDLVFLSDDFQRKVYGKLIVNPLFAEIKNIEKISGSGESIETIQALVDNHQAQPLYCENKLVGCVKRAHEFDEALSDHVMLENLALKASAALALQLLLARTGVHPSDIDYIMECSEEACGDMNQRGGGNFAKAIGEVCGCVNATGSDTRSFCAGPAHSMIKAAALVQSGIFKNVVVLAGGTIAKLGMNARDHVKKGMPVLEDVLGAFAVHVGEDDGVNPVIRTDAVGRHTIGSGGAPQAVMTAIVTDPLDKIGYRILDVDRYAPEMQNPEITEPAGAGDVPLANYKMIGALGVKRGELVKDDLMKAVDGFGMPGFAPTQGHIPSGVPFIGHARDMILEGKIKRSMIIGKGSLFLGRLTSLFDGISFLIEANHSTTKDLSAKTEISSAGANGNTANYYGSKLAKPSGGQVKIGLTVLGNEHGPLEILLAAQLAQQKNPDIQIVIIGSGVQTNLPKVEAHSEAEAHAAMDEMLKTGNLDAAVTMHYSFPIGVSTVGKVITPGKGKEMLLATTTGTGDTDRVAAMVKNALLGIATAKALGIPSPTVGLLNIDGAKHVERVLQRLREGGYPISFSQSARVDGGVIMRGNDLLQGIPDVMVSDSLTGNVLTKMLSAYSTGGSYEALGYGYGPGVGENYDKIICIISRASGAPTIAGAIRLAADCVKGGLKEKVTAEFAIARKAGLEELLKVRHPNIQETGAETKGMPEKKPVSEAIQGIEVMDLEDAVAKLWFAGIYAESGMGCTGPVIMVAPADKGKAIEVLREAGLV